MNKEQQMYYFTADDNKNTIYYLVNHQEERYCIIPEKHHKLAQYLYGLHLNVVNRTIEYYTQGYELRTFDNFAEYEF